MKKNEDGLAICIDSSYPIFFIILPQKQMFDFENLEVYKKAKAFNSTIYRYLQNNKHIDAATRNQLRRASLSIMLNIAEGTSRFSKADKKYFYIVSRGSIFECVSILSFLNEE